MLNVFQAFLRNFNGMENIAKHLIVPIPKNLRNLWVMETSPKECQSKKKKNHVHTKLKETERA